MAEIERKLKVLILENNQGQYRNMKQTIEKSFGHSFSVLPDELSPHDNLDYYFYLLKSIHHGQFDKILEHHHDVDVFIVDNSLDGDADHKGSIFVNYLKEK